MESIETKHIIRVKRKASDDRITVKRCKYIGTCDTSDERIEQLIKESPIMKAFDINGYRISDYDDFVPNISDDRKLQSLTSNETITCNGVALKPIESDSNEYIYDLFLYDDTDDLITEDDFERNDEDVSSNDENCVDNDYPDEGECDDEECDYYREWEYDDERDMRLRFERHRLSPDYDRTKDDDSDNYKYSDDSDDDKDE